MDEIIERLENLQLLIESQGIYKKEVLNSKEASQYLKLSRSHLYRLTSAGSIPHYRPNGKKFYFKRSELESWLLGYHITAQETQISKNAYIKNQIKVIVVCVTKLIDWAIEIIF